MEDSIVSTRTEICIANKVITVSAEDLTEEQIKAVAQKANTLISAEEDIAGFDEMKAVCIALFKLVGEYEDLQARYNTLNKSVDQLSGTSTTPKRSYTPARKHTVNSSTSDKK